MDNRSAGRAAWLSGGGGIRTLERPVTSSGFRDRRIRPLCHPSTRRSGEGGIRTLEGGNYPLNALAGRRLQPLGHFSVRGHGNNRSGRAPGVSFGESGGETPTAQALRLLF